MYRNMKEKDLNQKCHKKNSNNMKKYKPKDYKK